MADNGVPQKRFLYIVVQEASGKSKDQEALWEPSFTEGFVRVEVRGGGKTVKANTLTQSVQNLSITWNQELRVEVTEESKELRILLCKEKTRDGSGSRRNTAILAACGIFVQDILVAVPIDKYFELFKPGEDRERALGGFIRVTLKNVSSTQGRQAAVDAPSVQKPAAQARLSEEHAAAPGSGGRRKRGFGRILLFVGLAAVAAVVKVVTSRKDRP